MRKPGRSTEELVAELRLFNHKDSADRLQRLSNVLTSLQVCEKCGRPYEQCERKRDDKQA
jgi:hypothetical protein